jgi:adenosylcobinamide amidohydrolase
MEVVTHGDDGAGSPAPALVWRFARPMRTVASAVLGGGLDERSWVLNAQVTLAYHHDDPAEHVRQLAETLGLDPDAGVGLLTAARVRHVVSAAEEGVCCDATVGLSYPTWAAAPHELPPPIARWRPGTINLVCQLPVRLSDAALVNAVVTATEAKTQALLEAGVPETGTASDAIVVCCPSEGEPEPYAGPRSLWGARLARAVHTAVTVGTERYLRRAEDEAQRSSRSPSVSR